MSILEEHFRDISLHRDAEGPISVPSMIIPSKVDARKFRSFPVRGDIVVHL